jgi:hypothetical protein
VSGKGGCVRRTDAERDPGARCRNEQDTGEDDEPPSHVRIRAQESRAPSGASRIRLEDSSAEASGKTSAAQNGTGPLVSTGVVATGVAPSAPAHPWSISQAFASSPRNWPGRRGLRAVRHQEEAGYIPARKWPTSSSVRARRLASFGASAAHREIFERVGRVPEHRGPASCGRPPRTIEAPSMSALARNCPQRSHIVGHESPSLGW